MFIQNLGRQTSSGGMTSYVRDGTGGKWAAEKLECLEKYLSAYTTILRKQSDRFQGYFYIDAFAGAGRARLRDKPQDAAEELQLIFQIAEFGESDEERVEYIDGSPKIALGIEYPFTNYIFIDNNAERISKLQELKEAYADSRDISIREGNSNVELRDLVVESNIDWRRHRAVALLDPFGMQVPWGTIETLANTRAIGVIVNFPVGMAIQRLLPQSGEFSPNQRAMLTHYLGSPDWESVVYEETPDLFGETRISKVDQSGHRLAKWYQERLTRMFGFGARPRLIRNSQGGHLYYILFAGPNAVGAKIASHVLSRGETVP